MSLILEALRKSEAERQRGMPPRLDSPMLRPTRRRQRLAPGLALLVLGVPAAGWFVYRGVAPDVDGVEGGSLAELALQELDSAPTSAASEPATAPASALATNQVTPDAVIPATVNTTPAASAAASPDAAPTRSAMALVAQQREAALGASAGLSGSGSFGSELSLPERIRPHTPSMAQSEASSPVAVPEPAAPATETSVDAAPALAAQVPVTAPATPAPTAPPSPPVQVAVVAPAEPQVVAPPAPPAPAPAPTRPVEAIPFIYELDFSVRRDLPKMEMSMHVYSADPESRFVVVNGKRFAEGEQAETDVLLREVRREGAVLVFRGTAFVLPRQGF
jgi:general secretion pathway protein B